MTEQADPGAEHDVEVGSSAQRRRRAGPSRRAAWRGRRRSSRRARRRRRGRPAGPGRTASPLPRLVGERHEPKRSGCRRRARPATPACRRSSRRRRARPGRRRSRPSSAQRVGVEAVRLVEARHDDGRVVTVASSPAAGRRPTSTGPGSAHARRGPAQRPSGGVGVEDGRQRPRHHRPARPARRRRRVAVPAEPFEADGDAPAARSNVVNSDPAATTSRWRATRARSSAAGSGGGARACGRGRRTAAGGPAR